MEYAEEYHLQLEIIMESNSTQCTMGGHLQLFDLSNGTQWQPPFVLHGTPWVVYQGMPQLLKCWIAKLCSIWELLTKVIATKHYVRNYEPACRCSEREERNNTGWAPTGTRFCAVLDWARLSLFGEIFGLLVPIYACCSYDVNLIFQDEHMTEQFLLHIVGNCVTPNLFIIMVIN